ncbi:hypothetical protein Rcae01_06615 [Novipirellula caenicola]|uniref:Uncharacterized protein n=1 Tax=Novipirellula caenicola TaxID=1536901 RepID=A0ABP9W4L4_9BACT
MPPRPIAHAKTVSEYSKMYNAAEEYEYRDAEYEYEHNEQPEPRIAREWRCLSQCKINSRHPVNFDVLEGSRTF